MKIAVCGASKNGIDKDILKISRKLGAEIADKNHTLMFGACLGYPYEAAKGAYENKGEVVGFSPAKNKEEHISVYGFPLDNITKIEYTGLGIPGRNLPLVANSDAVIIVSGQIGTLNEFTIAFQLKKPIGVLGGAGGITNILKTVTAVCDNTSYNMKNKISFCNTPKELIQSLEK